jgi:hypothetical protein
MSIATIAASKGVSVSELVEQFGDMTYDLAEATFVGETELALGRPEGQQLVDMSAQTLAETAFYLGVNIEDLAPPETGATALLMSKARAYLRTGASRVAKVARAHTGGIIAGILAIGTVGTGYMWLTEDLQVRLAQVDSRREIGLKAVAKATPAQLDPIIGNLAKPPGLQIPAWGWAALALGGGLLAYRFWKRS